MTLRKEVKYRRSAGETARHQRSSTYSTTRVDGQVPDSAPDRVPPTNLTRRQQQAEKQRQQQAADDWTFIEEDDEDDWVAAAAEAYEVDDSSVTASPKSKTPVISATTLSTKDTDKKRKHGKSPGGLYKTKTGNRESNPNPSRGRKCVHEITNDDIEEAALKLLTLSAPPTEKSDAPAGPRAKKSRTVTDSDISRAWRKVAVLRESWPDEMLRAMHMEHRGVHLKHVPEREGERHSARGAMPVLKVVGADGLGASGVSRAKRMIEELRDASLRE